MMKLGILSDTHGNVDNVAKAMDIFKEHGVQEIIHCGDVGLGVIPLLAELPCHFVSGNCDGRSLESEIARHEQTFHGLLGQLERDGTRIGFLHGDDYFVFEELIEFPRFDLICYGHTHVFEWRIAKGVKLLNPGALARTPSPSVAILDVPDLKVKMCPIRH
ncbi:MAG: YfcE family phosphodiesterase [Planctomycetia bacterium]|nr:YfcE family phosphodiesterase [Planctomycetia bacterium]